MKIDRIYIEDYGIFRNTGLEDIDNGIVLIGGHNRAGKTSFMEALRNLPFGFQKGSSDIPANVEYVVESDITCDDYSKLNIKLKGYGEPRLYPLSGGHGVEINEICNVDRFTYRQLYTISLDELNNVGQNTSKLQAVLLGAGFKDAAVLPKLEKEFLRESERIGGKRGSISTKMFKPYSITIFNALKEKESALQETDSYTEKEKELKSTEVSINSIKEKIDLLDSRIVVLDVLGQEYSDVKRYNKIKFILDDKTAYRDERYTKSNGLRAKQLKERYIDALNKYDENSLTFKRISHKDTGFKKTLIENEDIILNMEGELSGIKERIKSYGINKSRWEEEKSSILTSICRINENFSGSFKEIMDIKCDDIEINEVKLLANDLREIEHHIDEINNKKISINSQINLLETSDNKNIESMYISPFIIIIACLFIFNGIMLLYGLKNNTRTWVYLISSLLVFVITVLYIKNKDNKRLKDKSFTEIQSKIDALKNELLSCEDSLNTEIHKKNLIDEKLQQYKKTLCIQDNVSPEIIKDYLYSLQNIKSSILKLSISRKDIEGIHGKLIKDEQNMLNMFSKLGISNELDIENTNKAEYEALNEYVNRTEVIAGWIPAAEAFNDAEKLLMETKRCIGDLIGEEDIDEYIEKCDAEEERLKLCLECEALERNIIQSIQTERVRRSIEKYSSGCKITAEEPLEILLKIYDLFGGIEDVESEYEKLKEEKQILEKTLDELKEKLHTLKNIIKSIMLSDRLKDAQKDIDAARGEMRPIAERYAVNAAAAHIVNRVYKNIMDKTQNSLLKDSSHILSEITGGEYIDILPPEELESIEFKTIVEDGSLMKSTNMLSRATKEQLFLSVRLSRIMQNSMSLPVIIDDSFVNFDAKHINNAIEIINKLSKTNQVFILTCHPYMIEYISEKKCKAQYWKLCNGKFSLSTENELMDYLYVH